MGAPRTILAVDLGTQSLRIAAVATDGTRSWSWSAPVETDIDGPVAEQDPRAWRALLLEGLAAAARAGVEPDAIATCGVLAGFVPVDAAGEPLGNAVMYNDGRAAAHVGAVEKALDGAGHGLRVVAADPLPQWLRLRSDLPAIAGGARHFLDATGWLNFVLTGEATLNSFSALRLYGPAVAARLDVALARFGRRTDLGEVIGPLRREIADVVGWRQPIPVIAATFDSKCAYVASALATTGSALDISGTVTSFGVFSDHPVVDAAQRIYAVPYGTGWLVRGSTAAAGSVVEWARRLMGVDFETFDALAAGAASGAGGLVLLPYHAGARSPLWQPHARGVLGGLSLTSGRPEFARSVYEGLACSLRHIVETVEACGAPVLDIRLSGGLARSPVLSQIKADILGKPLTAFADTELTTIGLAIIAAVAIGAFSTHRDAAECFVRPGQRFEPAPSRSSYDILYRRYLAEAGRFDRLGPDKKGCKPAQGAS